MIPEKDFETFGKLYKRTIKLTFRFIELMETGDSKEFFQKKSCLLQKYLKII